MTATQTHASDGRTRVVALAIVVALTVATSLHAAAGATEPESEPDAERTTVAPTGSVRSATGSPSAATETSITETAITEQSKAPKSMSAAEIRAAMADAEKRRQERLEPDAAVPDELAEHWGVQVIGIWQTSEGYMLDFRFRVIDAQKALPLFDHRIQPYVLTQRTNIKLPVPVAAKVGAFRPTNRGNNIKSDKIYYMVFGNPDSHVKRGDKVSVIIGDFEVEGLTVN